ncbi:hypothetical protein [Halochromatium salexigens]|uniref:hypothetical protein n=1 Tax=Halochromatium salexigens TaxID=49447 RepID=UPI001914B233|nr:hypothetical protein [Halochromatium salexigens]
MNTRAPIALGALAFSFCAMPLRTSVQAAEPLVTGPAWSDDVQARIDCVHSSADSSVLRTAACLAVMQ